MPSIWQCHESHGQTPNLGAAQWRSDSRYPNFGELAEIYRLKKKKNYIILSNTERIGELKTDDHPFQTLFFGTKNQEVAGLVGGCGSVSSRPSALSSWTCLVYLMMRAASTILTSEISETMIITIIIINSHYHYDHHDYCYHYHHIYI